MFLQGMFSGSSIPLLEQVVRFTEHRHHILAGNIANLDTPGYRVRDLSVPKFQQQLRQAVEASRRRRLPGPASALPAMSSVPGFSPPGSELPLDQVAENLSSLLYHDQSNVSLERQIAEMVKNQLQHNLALSIMANQFRLLRAAIGESADV